MTEQEHIQAGNALIIQGRSMAYAEITKYDEDAEGNFKANIALVEGCIEVGPEIEMKILLPYSLDQHAQITHDSRN